MLPLVHAHVEDFNGRFAIDSVVFAFQVVVVPADLTIEELPVRSRTEIHIAEFSARPVAPGSDDHLRFTASLLCTAVVLYADKSVDRPVKEDVEPAARCMHRNL